MTKRAVSFLRLVPALLFLVMLPMTAFAGGKSEQPAGGTSPGSMSGTIDFVNWLGEGHSKADINKWLALFNEKYPDVKVNFISYPFAEARKTIIQRHAAGNDADLISMNMPWLQDFLDLGALAPLDTYIKDDHSFPFDSLVKTPMQLIDGHRWMVPLTVTYFTMIYNKKMFADANLEPPRTWSEFRSDAKKLTDPKAGHYGFSMMMDSSGASNGPILTVYPMLYTTGSTTVKDGKPNINTPEMIKTLTLFKNLYDDGSIMPGAFSKSGNQTTADLEAGNAAMIIMPSEHPTMAREAGMGNDVGVCTVPIPDENGHQIARLHGIELSIPSGSKMKDAAWAFISWSASAKASLMYNETFGSIPPNLSVKDEYLKYLGSDELNKTLYSNFTKLGFVEELAKTPRSQDTWVAFTNEMQKMFLGKQTPAQTAAAIQAEWEKIFAQAK